MTLTKLTARTILPLGQRLTSKEPAHPILPWSRHVLTLTDQMLVHCLLRDAALI